MATSYLSQCHSKQFSSSAIPLSEVSEMSHYKLVQQFRCTDPKLQSFFDHVRKWRPTTWALLYPIQDHLICDGLPSDNLILETLSSHPTGTVLTVAKNASNQINSLVVERSFEGEWALLIGNCDSDLPPIPLHKGMKVVITQNRDKNRGFVNGQQATIVIVENQTIFLHLENLQTLNTHPVAYIALDGTQKTIYPLVFLEYYFNFDKIEIIFLDALS